MRKWLIFVLLLGVLILPIPAGAQGEIRLKSVNVELWSEYDQPIMLVIPEFVLDESTPLPAKVLVRFPKDGNLLAVAYYDGTLIQKDYEKLETQGNWQTVTLNVESYAPHRIEYYQPLTRDGNQRSFTYQWFGDYPVGQFNVVTQIPSDKARPTRPTPEEVNTMLASADRRSRGRQACVSTKAAGSFTCRTLHQVGTS